MAKTKQADVEAMYKSLEDGLGQCFPYGQDPLLSKIPADRIHLAPDSLKYRIFVEKRKEQDQLVAEALGTISRKPKLYCFPLKKASVPGGGPENEGAELILRSMPGKDTQWAIDGQLILGTPMSIGTLLEASTLTKRACQLRRRTSPARQGTNSTLNLTSSQYTLGILTCLLRCPMPLISRSGTRPLARTCGRS